MTEQKKNYVTKKKGKTECYPFWELKDIKNVIEYFEKNGDWDSYLTTVLEFLLGRRIGDILSMKWSDLYHENGRRKEEMTTLEEQKTGKTTTVPITCMVFEIVDIYCEKVSIDPMERFNDYIFSTPSKLDWLSRKTDELYEKNDFEKWCNRRDISEKRKNKIVEQFHKQNEYNSIGEYLYYVVEYMDIVKWQSDIYRKKLVKAVKENNITYQISTHSLRKSFGYWIYKIHPYDPDCLLSLQRLFNHADIQTTMHYIGLTAEKDRQYVKDLGDMFKNLMDGNTDYVLKNMPVFAMKTDDFNKIILNVIKMKNDGKLSDAEILNIAINSRDERRIS